MGIKSRSRGDVNASKISRNSEITYLFIIHSTRAGRRPCGVGINLVTGVPGGWVQYISLTKPFRKINICGAEQRGLLASLNPKVLLPE